MIAVVGMFAGCAKSKTHDNPFAIYNDFENIQVDIGDKRANVEKLLGVDMKYDTLFEEENINRVEYWDNEGVSVDYDMETGLVIGMRFEAPNWSIFNGLKVGDSSDTVIKQYPEGTLHKTTKSNDLRMAYDSDGNIITFSEEAPYVVMFKVTDGKVVKIVVTNNERYL